MTLAEVRPFGDRLLVRPDPKLQTTEGGLIIPDVVTADNPNYFTMTGVVLKLGDGIREDVYRCQNAQCRHESRRTVGERCPICGATQALRQADERRPFDCAVGDRVLFNRFAGKQIEVDLQDAKPGDFLSNHPKGPLGIIFRRVYGAYRRAARRHFIDHRKIQVAVN